MTVTPSIPPRVDDALTEMGRDVLVPINAMARWALAHREQVEAARAAYDASTPPSGRPEEDEPPSRPPDRRRGPAQSRT